MITPAEQPQKVVFDANVLLTAFLVPPSKSAEAVMQAMVGKIKGLVCKKNVQEVCTQLELVPTELVADLKPLFLTFLDVCKIEIVSNPCCGDQLRFRKTVSNRGDRCLVSTAYKTGAIICTNDIKDINPKTTLGIDCQLPDKLNWTGELTANSVVKGVLCRRAIGCVAIRFMLHIGREDFVGCEPLVSGLLEVRDHFKLDLITGPNLIRFQLKNAPTVELDISKVFSKEHYPLTVFASFDFNKGVKLIVATANGQIVKTCDNTKWDCPNNGFLKPTKLSLMRNARYPTFANYSAVFPYPMTERMVRKLLSGKTTDNPFERLSVEDMIDLLKSRK